MNTIIVLATMKYINQKEYTGISEALKFYITKRKIFVVSNKEILTTQKYLDYLD